MHFLFVTRFVSKHIKVNIYFLTGNVNNIITIFSKKFECDMQDENYAHALKYNQQIIKKSFAIFPCPPLLIKQFEVS